MKAKSPDGAYYLLGLAVEAALKACIAKKTKRFEFPDKSLATQCYTHDLTVLMKLAGLGPVVDKLCQSNSLFEINWAVVKDWRIESRYENNDAQRASDLYKAITDPKDGVMWCIEQNW